MVFMAVSLLPVCGCAGGCGGSSRDVSVTLRTMSIMGDEPFRTLYSDSLRQFTLEHPDIYLRDTTAEKADAFKLGATLESTYHSGGAPDIVYYYTNTGISELCAQNFMTLEEIREDYPDFASNISDGALDSVRATNGKVYCIPFVGEWSALAVNNELLRANGLTSPSDVDDLTHIAEVLSAKNIYTISNSADDSRHIIEWLVKIYGGIAGLRNGLNGSEEALNSTWLHALTTYSELCRSGIFAPASLTDALSDYVSSTDGRLITGSAAGISGVNDPIELFNTGKAAMTVATSDNFSRINVDDFSLIRFPSPGDAAYPDYGISIGYYTGYYITRKAYGDPTLRSAIIEWLEYMTDGHLYDGLADTGLISANRDSTGWPKELDAIMKRVNSGEPLSPSMIYELYRQNWSDIEYRAAELYYGVTTPQQMIELLGDSSLVTEDILDQWAAAVSSSDAAVSPSDAAATDTAAAS